MNMNAMTSTDEDRGQLVTFRLGRELFGIDIFQIQEVLHFQDVTEIPNSPDFVEGVIEVRDQVIPVVDLRKRMGVREYDDSRRRIVILDLAERPLGVIVDDISQVLLLEASDYEALPEAVVGDPERACVSSLAKADGDLVIVIAPERILTKGEHREIETILDAEEAANQEEAVSQNDAPAP